jgi:hypothetical protein
VPDQLDARRISFARTRTNPAQRDIDAIDRGAAHHASDDHC